MSNYQIITKIYESSNSLVYRAILQNNNQPIILKILKEDYPTPEELTRYKQEYKITNSLNLEGVIKAYELERYQNSLAILLEDFGGESLKKWLDSHHFTLKEFLTIAIKITESLGAVHSANIIHKDINPSNIVYNPETGQLKIIDFGISTVLSKENPAIRNPNRLEGTLAYISPEQTGRMNRTVDYRSDFYSLGVTLYELLTQQLPFEATEAIELVHCHIAKMPTALGNRVRASVADRLQSVSGLDSTTGNGEEIPSVVSDIVMKLMAKTAEERYQSAWGLKADLENCLQQLQTKGKIDDFSLGSQDITEELQIPQKLYGRETERQTLLDAFQRVTSLHLPTSPNQGIELLLVTGYSGIGKSALVNEVHKPIVQQRGYFISGKFDQFKGNIPYNGFIQAFQELIRQLLTESEAQLQSWQENLIEALGNNAQVIIDVIPEVELIVGSQPALAQLGAAESQNRFNLVLRKFIDVFSQKEHPLVIFLDDLQWADSASLKLIELLVADRDCQYLLLIGAYRKNEVDATHPLTLSLEQMQKVDARVNQMNLKPLNVYQVNQLISDTLSNIHSPLSTQKLQTLAKLVFQKTDGNPFFLNQLLQYLYTENLLFFNSDQGSWQWDLEQIREVDITDNVVDLMVGKIAKLPGKTQHVLKLAACIGNRFDLEILSVINATSFSDTAKDLWPALQKGLIIPLSNTYKTPMLGLQDVETAPAFIPYKFLHDRVQQAAYSLIPREQKKEVHLQIGQLLRSNTEEDELEEDIFDIVNQLNIGAELIRDQEEKNELAQLNLIAGRKAKAATAYEVSLDYLQTGLQLLGSHSWQQQYELTLKLHVETMEAEYLNTKFEEAEELAGVVLEKAKTLLDRVKIYEIKIQSYRSTLQLQLAIDTALDILAQLGVVLPPKPSKTRIFTEELHTKLLLRGKDTEDLVNLPAMTDINKLAAVRILLAIAGPAYIFNPPLFILIVHSLVNLCVKYGNSQLAAGGYVLYGLYLSGAKEDFDTAYQCGQLSLTLLNKFPAPQLKSLTLHVFNTVIRHWQDHVEKTIEPLQEGVLAGIENGDLEYSSYAASGYSMHRFFAGNELPLVEAECEKYVELMIKYQQEYSAIGLKFYRQVVGKLITGFDKQENQIIGDILDENQDLQLYKEHGNYSVLAQVYLPKIILFFLFKKYAEAYEYSSLCQNYQSYIAGMIFVGQHNFYNSLTMLALYSHSDSNKQRIFLQQVSSNQRQMAKWADSAPANYQHKYELVAAEKARVLGKNARAMEHYDRAIQGAKKQKYLQEEAIAYERAAEFYLSINREEIGRLYLKNAHHCYSRWGAQAKVEDLESEYPEFLTGTTVNKGTENINVTASTDGTDSKVLDSATVIKASQALASEIVLGNLLEKLMKTLIENAGAQRGLLILDREGSLVIEAEGVVDADEVTILQSVPLDSVDRKSQIPLLSPKIVNYVARTRENLVIDNAIAEEQFIRDPYITATEAKSILCAPLLNQGKLSGIVYLENNLTTGAFTPERVETLTFLATQAAISIENAHLYEQLEDYNQTLEQRVEERTKELSQTVDVLKATQGELVIENALLRSAEEPPSYNYQVGGSLPLDAPTYVVRSADRYLYKALRLGEFCYILNARQMGKSSLRVQMMKRLETEGTSCAAIDMSEISNGNIALEQWYAGLAYLLVNNLNLLEQVNIRSWWRDLELLSPMQRLGELIDKVLLDNISERIVVFLDEIDSVLNLNFSSDAFFQLIRACYNKRADSKEYQRLSFVLLGVATPSQLIQDPNTTPFNIGQAIQLNGFQLHEAQPLLQGLTELANSPQTLLKEVLAWTGGQPFLTQKICKFIRNSSDSIPINKEAEWVEEVVRSQIIANWESQDEPEHLRTIRDYLLRDRNRAVELLGLYQQIIQEGEVVATDSSEEKELLISGLVVKKNGLVQVNNPIYRSVFNEDWVESVSPVLGMGIEN